jgi:hypothetical protein
MFTSTAYEALYEYIGLELHSRFIEILTSQKIFLAIVLMIFGTTFFLTSVQFFSRYIPGSIVKRRSVPLSRYFQIVVCLFAGLSVLRVGSITEVKRFDGQSWHSNRYVLSKMDTVAPQYRVSFVFDLLSRSAEEGAQLITKVIDKVFQSTNSQVEAPDFFYKAILYAGEATIADAGVRAAISLYSNECIPRVLPLVGTEANRDRLDGLWGTDVGIDARLSELAIDRPGRPGFNCLQAKEEVRQGLGHYARNSVDPMAPLIASHSTLSHFDRQVYENVRMSSALLDHYTDDHEAAMGIQKGAQPPAGFARFLQYVNRVFSWDGILSVFGKGRHGAVLAAERSQEFSENLTRAPHVAGFIKLCLIALFPFLVFPIVAGRWRVLLWWMTAYSSVLLWTPIWTLLYHITTGIALSTEALAALGKLSDGISLYSADLIISRLNYMYSVYSWLQLLIGAAFSGSVLWFARPLFADSEREQAPEFIDTASSVTSKAGGIL